MPRKYRLSPEVLSEIKALYASGVSHIMLASALAECGIEISPAMVYYHLGLRGKKRRASKTYEDYLREDCKRRGVPYKNRRERQENLWG